MADVNGDNAGYDGMVRAGGPAQHCDLGGLTMTKVAVGPMDNNAYLLRCERSGEQAMIDAANDAATLLELIEAGGGPLTWVVTTHRHDDHWQALADVRAATGARTAAHTEDADAIGVPIDDALVDGSLLQVGACTLSVIHLVGHTPGSITVRYDGQDSIPHIFTGDSLFPGGVGNTHGNRADFERLIDDVEHKLFDVLPDRTRIYPGHGRDTTLGTERPRLPEWRARGW